MILVLVAIVKIFSLAIVIVNKTLVPVSFVKLVKILLFPLPTKLRMGCFSAVFVC